ncbi:MAG: ArsA family ATPase [Deltaproteobacteria bacterium]|nr:ArsA family ATPase [Deltaproteobacteria bacterium]
MFKDGLKPDIHFFIGKGGVGKSTTSALTALFFARSGRKTLLVSMDPAHNQRDLFEADFSEKPKKIGQNLAVKEVDSEYWINRYLSETREQIRKTYIYESAFNLQKHFKVLQFAPGLEEYALLLAFENVLCHGSDRDVIIFDMAPTALSLRFFSLPGISLVWLNELLTLRDLICRKKEIISKIRLGGCELERDRVKQKIGTLAARHTRLQQCFADDATHVHLVMNADRLSLSEAVRIQRRLSDIRIAIDRVVVNKLRTDDGIAAIANRFEPDRMSLLPMAENDLVGLAPLQAYVDMQRAAFRDFMPACRVGN